MSDSGLAEQNKALVRHFYEEFWRGNVALVDEFMDPDIKVAGVGREQMKALMLEALQTTPDLAFNIEEMIAEGDKVVYRWTIRSAHTQPIETPYGTAAPTGKILTSSGITIVRIQNSKIVEDRYIDDVYDLWRQLGVIPAAAPNSA